jgi:hypothetical protein
LPMVRIRLPLSLRTSTLPLLSLRMFIFQKFYQRKLLAVQQ